MTDDPGIDKQTLRAQMAARRESIFQALDARAQMQAACAHALRYVQDAGMCDAVLAGYMPMRSEIDPRAIMTAHPGPVCVPVVPGRNQPLEFHRWTLDTPMQAGRFKALVPVQRDLLVPQVLIVPLLAYDWRGFRLGYGGGFYDRTLEKLRAQGPVLAIGFGFEAQEVARVPTEATDQRLDAIITPSGLVRPL